MNTAQRGRSLALVIFGLVLCQCAKQDSSELTEDSTVYESRYVSASSLNCREQAEPTGSIVTRFTKNAIVEAGPTEDGWTSVRSSAGVCWVASRFLTLELPAKAEPKRRSSTKRRRPPQSESGPTSRRKYSDDYCPCSGTKICVGPRGGRFCITSGGNKRYGL